MLFSTALYQWAPSAVGLSSAGRPAQHRRVPGDAERGTQLRQHARGVGEHVIGIDHRRRVAEPVRLALEEFRLSPEPEILERARLALAEVGSDHPLRLADQEGVA